MFKRINYIIYNEITNRELKVGSECIKRFSGLKGTSNQEDIEQLINNFEVSQKLVWKLQELLPFILDKPTPGELLSFRSLSKRYIGKLDGAINGHKLDAYKKLLLGENPLPEHLSRILDALFEPTRVPVRRPTLRDTIIKEYESQKIKGKKTRVELTISRSKEDKPRI